MKKTQRPLLLLTALTALLAVAYVAPQPAQACGGLFCDNSAPVNQSAERILFIDHGNDTVTAVVEILYDGPSEEFSWLVPVPGVPEVGVSSAHVMDRLQQLTNPQYILQTQIEGNCDESGRGFANDSASAEDAGGFNNGDAGDGGGVSVIASGAVGPYNYQVIQVDPELDDPATAAAAWLEDNGYQVAGPELLREYLEAGMNLLGFKLQKNSSTGSVRPVTMTYQAQTPMIPIKLTGVAANDDMGVLVWVMGEWRAVPTNYRHLVLNEAAINWFNPGNNYNDVVNLAADEAGGQGFVTENAQSTSVARGQLVFDWESDTWEDLYLNEERNEGQLLVEATYSFGSWDGYVDVINALAPLPQGVSAEEFIACPDCYFSGEADLEGFERNTFLAMVRDRVVEPAVHTQELVLERPYMTRFYTTLSAPEMTLDPIFDFNGSLTDVDNVHTGTRYIMCGDEQYSSLDAPWRAELPSGQVVYGEAGSGTNWPYDLEDLPANERIMQLSTTGMGEVITDNGDRINGRLGQDVVTVEDGCACSTTHQPARSPWTGALALLSLLGLAIARRR